MEMPKKGVCSSGKGGRASQIILFIFILSVFFYVNLSFGKNITCNFTSSCSHFPVFSLQNDSGGYFNAHARNVSFGTYNYSMCCAGSDTTLSYNCSEQLILKLENMTNSHVQAGNYSGPGIVYNTSICMGAEPGTINCSFRDTNCPSSYFCLGSIASSDTSVNNLTNAHIGDCSEYSKKLCCSFGNNAPTVTLTYPVDNANTTLRFPTFNWTGEDADNDPLIYEINITCYSESGGQCSSDNRYITNINATNYTVQNYLQKLKDNGFYYNWTVRAYDGTDYSNWAIFRRLNIVSEIVTSMNVSNVLFGSMNQSQTKDTTTDNPLPFVLQNDGNCYINTTLNASSLWQSVGLNTSYYQFKVDNTTEKPSFSWLYSRTSWISINSSAVIALASMNWSDVLDTAEIDLKVTVPDNEGPGNKSSILVLTSSLGE